MSGEGGERRVASELQPLEGAACRVLHDRLLDAGKPNANLDHIVVSAAGIFLIDAKNWAGKVVEYEGSLWQHKYGEGAARTRIPMDPEVNKVRRMAEQMAASSSRVVEPVLCLTGDRADHFGEARTVRGVSVVPVTQLSDWLLARPRSPEPREITTEAVRLSAMFPPATAAQHPALTGVKVLIVVLVVIAFLAAGGMKVVTSLPDQASKASSRMITAPITHTSWTAPCAGLTNTFMSKAIGRPVYSFGPPSSDTCRWSFKPHPKLYLPADVRVTTGWLARYVASKENQAEYLHDSVSEGLYVPQLAAVPGSSVPAAQITQPINVSVTYYGTNLSPAVAKAASVKIAQELAKHMPSGPGSTDVRVR
jgi:hypothetical protein